jgi:hypothetical protein
MKRHDIWLLFIPTLITAAALTIGWSDADAMRRQGVSISGANLPVVSPYNGDPDPGTGAPLPRMIARDEPTQYRSTPPAWVYGIRGVWAMWYLRIVR